MGADLKGRLNQSVPVTREVNMWGSDIISYHFILLQFIENMQSSKWHKMLSKMNLETDIFPRYNVKFLKAITKKCPHHQYGSAEGLITQIKKLANIHEEEGQNAETRAEAHVDAEQLIFKRLCHNCAIYIVSNIFGILKQHRPKSLQVDSINHCLFWSKSSFQLIIVQLYINNCLFYRDIAQFVFKTKSLFTELFNQPFSRICRRLGCIFRRYLPITTFAF